MSYKYLKVQKKRKSEDLRVKVPFLFLFSLLMFYSLFFPSQLGIVGLAFRKYMLKYFGYGMYLIPLFTTFYGFSILRKYKITIIHWILSLLIILFSITLIEILTGAGGVLGDVLYLKFFYKIFGKAGSIIIVIAGLIYTISYLFNIPFAELKNRISEIIVNDLKEWQRIRSISKKVKQPQVKQPRVENNLPKKEPVLSQPVFSKQENIDIEKNKKVESVDILKSKSVMKEKEEVEKKKYIEQKKTVSHANQYIFPGVELLSSVEDIDKEIKHDIINRAAILEQTLANFNVRVKVTDISPGPVISRYELTPEPGVKVQQITALEDDIALAMKSASIRILAPVPGKGTVGIEIPNQQIKIVGIKEVIESEEFINSKSKLTIALGKTADGKPYISDLIPMPHLLIAGATGSGKSVCIHSIIVSILYKSKPDDVKFLMIDPKRLELPVYNGLPYIYDPKTSYENAGVVTKPKDALESLKCLVRVMEKRYEKFAKVTVRNIDGYNELMEKKGEKKEFYIVVIIDELADLMLSLSREIEDSIQRLAQMARAVGIHLVLATQRPSVDVITGVIKANLSARIAFQVLSKTDSRVILDSVGAEDLLGRGDMLFLPTGAPKPIRLQGSYISEKEVEKITNFIREQKYPSFYNDVISIKKEESEKQDEKTNVYLIDALKLILERRRVSQDLLKAKFGSSARASDILSLLEVKEFIYKPEGTNRWQIHFNKVEEFLETHGKEHGE